APVPPAAADLPGVRVVAPPVVPEPGPLLDAAGLRVTTMGRGPGEDPLFFAAAAAAGAVGALAGSLH
ncbi:MAG: hypothetical protein KGR17_11175, partial [Acidobacteria bacterium]|nr:hypothetical protein [Acidobacteriota bacterium]